VAALQGASLAAGTLDERDQQVVQLLSDGRTNAEIAAALGLSATEVDRLLMEMYARIGVASRSDVTALALRDETAR
jgi:DNA-binding NarL/FixJ family response regulator